MVKSLSREQNLVGVKQKQAKAHFQQVPALEGLKPHYMGYRYPMIMKQKFSRMKFQQVFPSLLSFIMQETVESKVYEVTT